MLLTRISRSYCSVNSTLLTSRLSPFVNSLRCISIDSKPQTPISTKARLSTLSPSAADSFTPPPNNGNRAPKVPIDFDDPEVSYGGKPIGELLRAYVVFNCCTIKPLVRNAEFVYSAAVKILGHTLVDGVVKRTFFAHFCGGEDVNGLRPKLLALRQSGVNGILDYAAENAPDEKKKVAPLLESVAAYADRVGDADPSNIVQSARVYDYAGEAACDHHVEVFKKCIMAVRDVTPHGFAAMKLTALGNPKLLESMSVAIVEAGKLFEKFDKSQDGLVSVEEFRKGYDEIFVDAEAVLPGLIVRLDPYNTGFIDYIEWSKLLRPNDLPRITASCRDKNGPLFRSTPNPEELKLMLRMKERTWEIAQLAYDNDVRLLVDAEQTYFQPAIDNFVISLCKKFNDKKKTDVPIIFNTYQGYLKDSKERVETDVKRAERNNYHFAAKVVRGAYMVAERQRAEEEGVPSPVCDDVEDTHKMYDSIISFLLKNRLDNNNQNEVMLGTHNRQSIERAISFLDHEADGIEMGVHFAQLLGMRDDLTFGLGRNKYHAYKYVPYGLVAEVMPYLIRRAQENSDITAGMGEEVELIKKELRRRFKLAVG